MKNIQKATTLREELYTGIFYGPTEVVVVNICIVKV